MRPIQPVDSGAAGTVWRGCWNGMAGLLERYGGAAGTVSAQRFPGLSSQFGLVPPLRALRLLGDMYEFAANLIDELLTVFRAGLRDGI